jgi:hypothetical protein
MSAVAAAEISQATEHRSVYSEDQVRPARFLSRPIAIVFKRDFMAG